MADNVSCTLSELFDYISGHEIDLRHILDALINERNGAIELLSKKQHPVDLADTLRRIVSCSISINAIAHKLDIRELRE